MTTYSTDTRIRSTDDATFQEWVTEWHTALTTIGLTQTADTGQINPATVSRPSINTYAGYSIWRFNDTQQATAPLFIRIQFGSGSVIDRPLIGFSIGTGSDGSGNLTGVFRANQTISNNSSATIDTTYASYWVYNASAGVFAFGWKVTSGNYITGAIYRTVDSNGAPSSLGIGHFFSNATNNAGHYDVEDAIYTSGSISACPISCAYGNIGNVVDDNGNTPVHLCFVATPKPYPVIGVCAINSNAAAIGATFSATLVGATAYTYIHVGGAICVPSSAYTMCMVWE